MGGMVNKPQPTVSDLSLTHTTGYCVVLTTLCVEGAEASYNWCYALNLSMDITPSGCRSQSPAPQT